MKPINIVKLCGMCICSICFAVQIFHLPHFYPTSTRITDHDKSFGGNEKYGRVLQRVKMHVINISLPIQIKKFLE